MNADRLVNLVCNRLLNNPIPERPSIVADRERAQRVFDINDYDRLNFRLNDWDSQKAFYPYFKSRGIKLDTQRDFHNNFFIAIREGKNGKQYANLSFPMQKPSNLGTYVGLEERSRANTEGKTLYKGMAAGTNATEGMGGQTQQNENTEGRSIAQQSEQNPIAQTEEASSPTVRRGR